MNLRPTHIPRVTYRLQFSAQRTFDQARQLVAYLRDLGVGEMYASPLFKARDQSSHGYDVVDHGSLDPHFGSEADFHALCEELSRCGLGLMMDVVPNHMGIDDPQNAWWQDVLENGQSSIYAKFFDIDWHPPKEELKGKVLLPILGDQYGKVLENQELKLVYEDQRFLIAYYDRRFPVAPRSSMKVLQLALERVAPDLPAENPERMELESIITELENLPKRSELDPERIQQRYREKEVARRRLATLLESSGQIRTALDQAVVEFNGQAGNPRSFDRLEALLGDQAYRLSFWRVATDEINYRRFFDINELAAIRVEDPEVFQKVHELAFRFLQHGCVTSLRIDHPDGLLDPQQYFVNLQEGFRKAIAETRPPSGVADAEQPALYVAVEKILAHDENLPAAWPVAGTTGYEFLNLLNGLFVDRRGAYALREIYNRFTGNPTSFGEVLYESKSTILNVSMSSELHVLSRQLDRISEQHRFSRDFTRSSLRRALREVIACFPVYRSYIRPGVEAVSEDDRRRIRAAIRTAKRRNPALSGSFFDFIASVLLLEDPDGLTDEQRHERRQFVLRFQQLTGPVTAKGWEDTAFYRYYPLASLNEVGGDPSVAGTSVEHFHRRIADRVSAWPYAMSATGTHDAKRGEDCRARLNVLSELPEEWDQAVRRWQSWNERFRVELDGAQVPDANEEYLLYQTLVGTWPLDRGDEQAWSEYVERITRYMEKALKEAKLHTSWLSPYEEYDQAIATFIRSILAPSGDQSDFLPDMDALVQTIADAGFVNSLAQTLLKICVPGVPDLYQGSELWDFNLVDPDNRRPVNFEHRRKLLAELQSRAAEDLPGLVAELLERWPDERVKLFVTWRALDFRRRHPDLFLQGTYEPLSAQGLREANLCVFARVHGPDWLLAAVPRFTFQAWSVPVEVGAGSEARLSGRTTGQQPQAPTEITHVLATWLEDTRLSLPIGVPQNWEDVFTGESYSAEKSDDGTAALSLATLCARFPLVMLAAKSR
ncbi:MAG: malto-oligosyltrehalose synthase [Planctomycetes bacterium]|nr:malto-oligosyltrehalose synthase [Planctomycetota bacterium]